jgi:hypothetical protein
MNGAAAHTHSAAATKMSAATPATEVSTTTSTTEVTTAATAAEMSAPAAASRVSNSRQTKGKAYCGRACCDFPHDTTSSSGPNAQCQRQITRSVPAVSCL